MPILRAQLLMSAFASEMSKSNSSILGYDGYLVHPASTAMFISLISLCKIGNQGEIAEVLGASED